MPHQHFDTNFEYWQALDGHCSTERDELYPELAAHGDGNSAPHAGMAETVVTELEKINHRSLSKNSDSKVSSKQSHKAEKRARKAAKQAKKEERRAIAQAATDLHPKIRYFVKKGYPDYIVLDKVNQLQCNVSTNN